MKKVILGLMLVLAISSVYAGGNSDSKIYRDSEEAYLNFKSEAISEIESKLSAGKRVRLDNYLNRLGYLYAYQFRRDIPKVRAGYDKNLQDLRDALDKYRDLAEKNDAFFVEADQKFDDEYDDLISKGGKYYPTKFEHLKPEAQQRILLQLLGREVVFKGEWDTSVAKCWLTLRRAIGIISEDYTEESVRIALDWVIANELVWQFGYVNRFTSYGEYSAKMEELELDRGRIVRMAERDRWTR